MTILIPYRNIRALQILLVSGIAKGLYEKWTYDHTLNCTLPLLQAMMKRPIFQDVKKLGWKKGWQRFLIKDDLNPSPARLGHWNPLTETPPFQYKFLKLNPYQAPSRLLGKRLKGKALDFLPVQNTVEALEGALLRKVFRQKNKKFVNALHFPLAGITFPLTGVGLTLTALSIPYLMYTKMELPSYLGNFDYRYKDAKDRFDEMKKLIQHSPEYARVFQEKFNLTGTSDEELLQKNIELTNQARASLSSLTQVMNNLGIRENSPEALDIIAGDSTAIDGLAQKWLKLQLTERKKKNLPATNDEETKNAFENLKFDFQKTAFLLNKTIFSEVAEYANPEFKKHPPENIVFHSSAPVTPEQRRNLYKTQLSLLYAQDELYENTNRYKAARDKVKAFFGFEKDKTGFFQHLDDPFIKETLPQLVKDGKTDRSLVPFHAAAHLEATGREEMMKILDATQLAYTYAPQAKSIQDVRITSKPLSVQEVDEEMIKDTIPSDNIVKKFRELQQWRAEHEKNGK